MDNQGACDAVGTSVKVGLLATAVAAGARHAGVVRAVRGTGSSDADSISLLMILPIALPGIVTGMALNNAFRHDAGHRARRSGHGGRSPTRRSASSWCSTTCARGCAQLGGIVEEASMDLGASRWTTFRLVTFPLLRSALLAGAPARVRAELRRDRRDHVHRRRRRRRRCRSGSSATCSGPTRRRSSTWSAAVLILVSIMPIYLSQRLSGSTTGGRV